MTDAAPPARSRPKRVLLVGWEGADWRLIEPLLDNDRMPHLTRLTNRGVMGNLGSLIPMVCPILWTSIVTGVPGDEHGILTFVEPDGRGDVRPVQSTSRRRKALWNILSQNGLRSAVIGWPVTHPAEPIDGVVVTERFPHTSGPAAELWPADTDTVHPHELHDRLMALRVHPDTLTPGQIAAFVPRLSEIGPAGDRRIAVIASSLAQTATIQNAATFVAQHVEWDFMAVHYGALGDLSHEFMKYRTARTEPGEERDTELYGDVVNTAYTLYDKMIGRLIELSGPDTLVVVVSDHGFYPEPVAIVSRRFESQLATLPSEPRQKYLRHHRRDAVFCAAGPGVKIDELVIGAQIPDIAPTVLAALGIPVPSDIGGNVLTAMFDTPPDVDSIDSFEPEAPRDGTHARDLIEDPWSAHEIIENLAGLGFLELDSDSGAALEVCLAQRALNCAEIHTSKRRYEQALGLYRELRGRDDSFITRVPAVQCLIALGRLDEAEIEIREIETHLRDPSAASWLWVMLHAAKGDLDAAEKRLEPMLDSDILNIDVLTHLGWLSLRSERWEKARRLFELVLERDPDQARAHDGLGVALLRLGDIDGSIAHHLQSVTLFPHRSRTHERLGDALVAGKQFNRAIRAYETAVQVYPDNSRARKMLSYTRRLREREWRQGIDASTDPDDGGSS